MKNSRTIFGESWLDDVLLLVLIFVLLKAVLIIVAIAADQVGYFCNICHDTNVLWAGNLIRSPLSTLQTWDAQNYLKLAADWYVPGEKSIAFFPLLPGIINVVWFFAGESFLIAQALVTLISFATVTAFYAMVRLLSDRRIAVWSAIVLITFPTAFFLHLIYTEGVFILLFSLVVIGTWQRMSWLSGITSVLLVLSRPHGIVAVIGVLAAFAWTQRHAFSRHHSMTWASPFFAPLAGALSGAALYLGNMYHATGDPLSGFAIQKKFGSGFDFYYLTHPLQWIHDALLVEGTFMSINHSSLSRLIFFFTLIGLVLMWRSKTFRAFVPLTAVLIAMSALPGTLASYARYALSMVMIFPAIVDVLLEKKKTTREKQIAFALLLLLVIVSTIAQLLLFFYHASNLWVG